VIAIAFADFGDEAGRLFRPVRQHPFDGMAHVVKCAGRAGDRGEEPLRLGFEGAAGQLRIGQFNVPAQVLQFPAGEGKVVGVEAAADLLAAGFYQPIVDTRR